MILLALETSSKYGSIALFRGERLLEERFLPRTDGTAKTLAPAINELLASHEISPRNLDLIAVTAGPGSFTGLRIGIVTAKMLAYASKAEVIGVNTLQVLAEQASAEAERVTCVMDAQRSQLFAADFQRVDSCWQFAKETHIVDRDPWIQSQTTESLLIGPVLHRIADKFSAEVSLAAKSTWEPAASSVGNLGRRLYESGQRDDYWKLAPNYFRLSAAEEKAKKLEAES